MARKLSKTHDGASGVPKLLVGEAAAEAMKPHLHIYHCGAVCDTDKRGHRNPENRKPNELVLDATEGFIPLWEKDTILRWRFNEASMSVFVDPAQAKAYFRGVMSAALVLWGSSVPVRFSEVSDAWDFEVIFRPTPDCTPNGCVLASAFFPDAGQHDITMYPTLLEQPENELVEVLAHEFGHVFGLRHFFAQVAETAFPSEIFGTHNEESIMNYGVQSKMTEKDREDLKSLYAMAWSGELTHINGTPIRLIRPFSHFRVPQLPLALAARIA